MVMCPAHMPAPPASPRRRPLSQRRWGPVSLSPLCRNAELDCKGKVLRALTAVGKLLLLLCLLYTFVCSLDVLSSAFQLVGGERLEPAAIRGILCRPSRWTPRPSPEALRLPVFPWDLSAGEIKKIWISHSSWFAVSNYSKLFVKTLGDCRRGEQMMSKFALKVCNLGRQSWWLYFRKTCVLLSQ